MTANAEQRLIEWARDLHFPDFNAFPPRNVLKRIRDEGAGASQGTAEQNDGGLGRMVDRMAASIERSRRCAEVREAFEVMPADYQMLAKVAYRDCPSYRDVPRDSAHAAATIGISLRAFFYRKKLMLEWLGDWLCIQRQRRVA